MLIAYLFIAIINCFSTQAALPKESIYTNTALRLKNELTKAEKTTKKPRYALRTKKNRTTKTMKNKKRAIKEELLIEKCNSLQAIAQIITSFLTPYSIPAWQTYPRGEEFVRSGCDRCASAPRAPFMTITSQGTVRRITGHYETHVQGEISCVPTESLESERPLHCNRMVALGQSYYHGYGPLTVNNKYGKNIKLGSTCLYYDNYRQQTSLQLDNHNVINRDNVTWYQQCFNPQAKTDRTTQYNCNHHFVVALVTPQSEEKSLTEYNALLIWSLPDGKLQSSLRVPAYMYLCTYKQRAKSLEEPVFPLVGVDGFLWWADQNNGRLARLDYRGTWEYFPRNNMLDNPVWQDISPNAQWLLERYETVGHRTTFAKMSLQGHSINLQAENLKQSAQPNLLWKVTMGLWLDTLFKNYNQGSSTIHMEPRWILRYQWLKKWLANDGAYLAQGLQKRICDDLDYSPIIKRMQEEALKNKKRKRT